jgi:hypothetical protein
MDIFTKLLHVNILIVSQYVTKCLPILLNTLFLEPNIYKLILLQFEHFFSNTTYTIRSYALGCQVEGEDNNGDMCRKPQEKSCMTSSSFNVRILFEFISWVVTAILLWFLIILFDVDA